MDIELISIKEFIRTESFFQQWEKLTGEKVNDGSSFSYFPKFEIIKRFSSNTSKPLSLFNIDSTIQSRRESQSKNKKETVLKPLEDLSELFLPLQGKNLFQIADGSGKYRGIDIDILAREKVFFIPAQAHNFFQGISRQGIEPKEYFLEANREHNMLANLVLPIFQGDELKNIQFRNFNRLALDGKGRKILNLSGRNIAIRGLDNLVPKEEGADPEPVFIVEGDFEYFTCLQHGYKALAINSISNGNKVFNELKKIKEERGLKGYYFIICFNKDKEGFNNALKSSKKLLKGLNAVNIKAYLYNQYKADEDLNDMQMRDPEIARDFLRRASVSRDYYLQEKYFPAHIIPRIDTNSITRVITGGGKSTAYVENIAIIQKALDFVIVVPTIQLVKDFLEKFSKFPDVNAHGIYSGKENPEGGKSKKVTRQLAEALGDGARVIILTYETYNKNLSSFELGSFRTVFDEAHKILNYKSIARAIRGHRINDVQLVSATTSMLEAYFPNFPVQTFHLRNEKLDRQLEVFDIVEHNLSRWEKKAEFIFRKWQEHGKVVVHLNQKSTAKKIKTLLEERGLKVYLFNAELKEVRLINEMIEPSDFDVILATSSLTEGVSFRNDVYSLFIATQQDTLDNVPQFLARNRNDKTRGGIICKLIDKPVSSNSYIYKNRKAEWIGKTDMNLEEEEAIIQRRKDLLNKFCSLDLLEKELKFHEMKVVLRNSEEEEEQEQEQEQEKKLKITEAVAREFFIAGKFADSTFWRTAQKLLKLLEQGQSEDKTEKAQLEVMRRTLDVMRMSREEFWNTVITDRKKFKNEVKEVIRRDYGEQFATSTDENRLDIALDQLEKASINKDGEPVWTQGKKQFFRLIRYLLNDTLSAKEVKTDIEYLIEQRGYIILEKTVKGKKYYRLER